MSNHRARVPADQQYQLIMECRNSGLSDYQWCKEHDINPGTFYNWVSRLRKKTCYEIPEPVFREAPVPALAQEVVKLDLFPKEVTSEQVMPVSCISEMVDVPATMAAMIEISLGKATFRIANGTDPAMLDRVLSLVKGAVC